MKKKIIRIILFLLALFMCIPIFFIISGSLMGQAELEEYLKAILTEGSGYVTWSLIPMYPTLRSIVELLLDSPEFFVMFWNSIKIVVYILIGQSIISIPAAWAFSQYKIPFKKILFTLYIVLMLMPFQVTMLSSYLVLDKFKMIDTQLSLIMPAIFSTFPIFIMYRFFDNIPKSYIEAARVDGASEFKIFMKIGIPLGKPGIISALILNFIEYWNMIEQPLIFIKSKSQWPLSLFLPNVSMSNVSLAFIASLVTMITSLIIFFAGQKYLKQGIISIGRKEQ